MTEKHPESKKILPLIDFFANRTEKELIWGLKTRMQHNPSLKQSIKHELTLLDQIKPPQAE